MSSAESDYDIGERASQAVALGLHREFIGGLWDEVGSLQAEFMIAQGLTQRHRLLDIGCGCLRGGVRFIDHLDAGGYFGVDRNAELLAAGYDLELARAGLQHKLPRSNLIANGEFDFGAAPSDFAFALAVSVFSHISFNRIRTCLERLSGRLQIGGKFFASYFEARDGRPVCFPVAQAPGAVVTYGDRDPFHYRAGDLAYAALGLPWRFERIGDWRHPRGQQMACFTRIEC